MKSFFISLLGSIAMVFPLAAETLYTIPQGYTKVAIPAAPSTSQPSLTAISATLLNDVEFAGTGIIDNNFDPDPDSDAETANTSQMVTVTGAAWTAGQWTSQPHLAYMKNSTGAEEAFLITENSVTKITVDGGFNLLASSRFPATSTPIEIRKANTIGGLLGTTTTSLTSNDQVFLWDGGGWQSYIPFDGEWYLGSGPNAGDVATDRCVFPEEGLFVQRAETTPATLTFFGEVPVGPQASTVPGSASSFISTRFPIGNSPATVPTGVLLPDLNIDSIPNWSTEDSAYLWTGSSWQGFVAFNGDWYYSTGADAGDLANTYLVKANSAIFVTRRSTGADSNSTLAIPAPYTIQTSE